MGDRQSSINLSQLRLIDTKRLAKRIAVLETDKFEKIRKTIRGII